MVDKSAFFQRVWEHCAAKPGAVEDHPWGDTVFKVKGKIFAFLSDPASPDVGITLKPDEEELDALLGLPFVRKAAYVGRFGWVSVSIEDEESLELALSLIDDSYDIVSKRTRRKG
jgi:predicted DNA-binding protein (MmcQ/YjbR family)